MIMNIIHATFIGLVLCHTVVGDEFYNFDFNTPNLTHVYDDPASPGAQVGPASEVFAGWSLMIGNVPYPTVSVSLGSRTPVSLRTGFGPEFGAYSTYLHGILWDLGEFPLSLSHGGTVPTEAEQLWFYVPKSWPERFEFRLNGVSQEVLEADGPFYHRYVNVSPHAGQNLGVELYLPVGQAAFFDVFGFADRNGNLLTIPEPSTFVLLGLGGLGLGWSLRRRRG